MLDDQTMQEIVRRVLTVTNAKRNILFGSAATGTKTADSDIDLLVVKDDASDPIRESIGIRRALKGIPFPFDIFVVSTDSFERTKNVIGSLTWPATQSGKILYDAA